MYSIMIGLLGFGTLALAMVLLGCVCRRPEEDHPHHGHPHHGETA